jgi:hypothetical protein
VNASDEKRREPAGDVATYDAELNASNEMPRQPAGDVATYDAE